ncbi:MAG: translation initiation factor IF-2 [Candidatus Omnitrophota bacterium]
MKVHELAKELETTSSELIKTLASLGIKAKDHLSTLTEANVKKARLKFKSALKSKAKEAAKKTKKKITVSKVVKKKKKEKKPKEKPSKKVKETPKTVSSTITPIKPAAEVVVAERPPVSPKKEKPIIEIKEERIEEPKKKAEKLTEVEVGFPINVKDLAVKINQKTSLLIKNLMDRKVFVTINQSLKDEVAKELAHDFGYELKPAPTREEKLLAEHLSLSTKDLKPRHPVVTFMGHVDHGKTSILDYIRKSKLADKEHGGITQHIGAYGVTLPKGKITFLDTPGHEAFTAMRARGANVTDIVVLVVAADDGVMPQTIEAINHAKAANVPIVIAINKADKAPENVDNVKRQLIKYELTAEDLGGKTITVAVSAKTGQGIDELLELILLEAELLELKADFSKPANGVVVESNLSKGRGVEVTVLVQQGVLHLGDTILIEEYCGNVKAMFDSLGRNVSQAEPATAVKILGLPGVPQAGEKFYVVADEKIAREIAEKRRQIKQKQKTASRAHITLEDLHKRIQEGKVKELPIILKADVQGSVEALADSLKQLSTEEVKITIIHAGVGEINSSDVVLAAASDAIIIGFHVEPDSRTKEFAQKEGVEIRTYRIIYEAIQELKAALEGLLEPTIRRKLIGRILVKKMFNLTKAGKVAGCFVQKGKVSRSNMVTVLRNGEKIFEGKISNLKRFKDDVREVAENMECGISLSGFSDIQEGDIVEAFEEERIARKL